MPLLLECKSREESDDYSGRGAGQLYEIRTMSFNRPGHLIRGTAPGGWRRGCGRGLGRGAT